jgi:hypothetical protein
MWASTDTEILALLARSTITPPPTPPSSTPRSAHKTGSALSTGARISIGVCIPLVLIIVGFTIFLLLHRRKRRSNTRTVNVGAAETPPEFKGPAPYMEHQDHDPIVHGQISAPWHPTSSPRPDTTHEAMRQIPEIAGSPVNKTATTEARELDSGTVYEISAQTDPHTLSTSNTRFTPTLHELPASIPGTFAPVSTAILSTIQPQRK